MKHPLSVIIVTKDPKTLQEIHNRFDTETALPRLALLFILLRAFFTSHL